MAHFELLDDGSRACVVRVMPLDLSHAEAEKLFDRHVADVRSRHEDRIAPPVRAQWVPQGTARESCDLVVASCWSCARFVLSLPPTKWPDIVRVLGSFDVFVLRLLNGWALFRKGIWHVQCRGCSEQRRRSAWHGELRKA